MFPISKKSKKNLYRSWVAFSTKKKMLLIAYVLLIAIALASLLYVISVIDRSFGRVTPKETAAAQKTKSDAWDGYQEKEGLETYLFIGTDGSNTDYSAQADTIIVLNLNHPEQTYQYLVLNRDTMTDVTVPDMFGQTVTTEFEQIALANTYLQNPKKNALNTCRTIQQLLHAPELDGYFCLSVDGIPVLADALGGITVHVEDDFSAVDPSIEQGSDVLLTGDQVETFIRARKDVDDQTNISRMRRHQAFIEGLHDAMEGKEEKELLDLYDTLQSYLTTNLGSQKWVDLAEFLDAYQGEALPAIEGEQKVEKGFWAFYPDPDSLKETSIQLFYEKKGEM